MSFEASKRERGALHSPLEVLRVFLRLGCTSFGGPIAHLGYFREELVERRGWVSESVYAELIAMAQALPGPSSSQVGFALGMLRAGWPGAAAAWVGFTLPSAVLMLALALGRSAFDSAAGGRLLHGFQLVAVAVVAQAVLSLQRTLAPDRTRTALAVGATGLVLLAPVAWGTVAAMAAGALAGLWLCRGEESGGGEVPGELSRRRTLGVLSAALALGLLAATWLVPRMSARPWLAVAAAFYRSGALVFGGGHVVLPLLESTVVARGWVAQPVFLAGYGAAQAMPGPLFSFGAFLGASTAASAGPTLHRVLYGLLALVALFLPGVLLMAAVLPFWHRLRSNASAQAALRGVNAAVVGLLLAALFRPLWTATIRGAGDFWVALLLFTLLTRWRVPPWAMLAGAGALSLVRW